MADAEKMARMFKVLSVDTRLKMVLLLKERTLCVNALAGRLKVTPAAVSQHLRVLRDAGLVEGEKDATGLRIVGATDCSQSVWCCDHARLASKPWHTRGERVTSAAPSGLDDG